MMESAKYAIKEAAQAIQDLDLVKTLVTSTNTLEKECEINDISEIIDTEKQDISPAVYHML